MLYDYETRKINKKEEEGYLDSLETQFQTRMINVRQTDGMRSGDVTSVGEER